MKKHFSSFLKGFQLLEIVPDPKVDLEGKDFFDKQPHGFKF